MPEFILMIKDMYSELGELFLKNSTCVTGPPCHLEWRYSHQIGSQVSVLQVTI